MHGLTDRQTDQPTGRWTQIDWQYDWQQISTKARKNLKFEIKIRLWIENSIEIYKSAMSIVLKSKKVNNTDSKATILPLLDISFSLWSLVRLKLVLSQREILFHLDPLQYGRNTNFYRRNFQNNWVKCVIFTLCAERFQPGQKASRSALYSIQI